jgi:hypothetical protein
MNELNEAELARRKTGIYREQRVELSFRLPLACSLLCWTILRPWRWRRYVPPKRRVPLNALHSVISQKKILFKTTAVKTSNPIYQHMCFRNYESGSRLTWTLFFFSKGVGTRTTNLFVLSFLDMWLCPLGLHITGSTRWHQNLSLQA